jgi:DNA polymerase-3 subunit alpha
MPNGPFVSLHNHTEQGSPLDGMNDVGLLFEKAKELDHPSIAITDHGTMTAHYDAYKASQKTGVKLIPGMEVYFAPDLSEKKSNHMVLVPKTERGYKNILRLNYEAYNNQASGYMGKLTPRISWNHIEEFNEDIFCLTACSNGVLSRDIVQDRLDKAEENVLRLKSVFKDRLFLEIQPHALKTDDGNVDQVKLNDTLIGLSRKHDIPYVATCDAHYLDRDHAKYHDMMLAIKDKKPLSDPNRFRYGVQEMYLKPFHEITDFFGNHVGTIAMNNSLKIAAACEEPHYLKSRGAILPQFPVKHQQDYIEFKVWWQENCEELPEDKAYLRYRCVEGFKLFTDGFSPEKKRDYWNRVKYELSVLELHNFSSYMLIVADYINWANNNGVIVGPARGSGAGSLVAFLIGITKVDPIKYNLLFERFHNKQKKSFPDIDSDFSHPDKVKAYIKERYGKEYVAQISNWSTLSPKVVLKDVARSLEIGGDKSSAFEIANHLTSIMPDVHTIEEAIDGNKEFAKFMQKYPDVKEFSTKLQNLTRQWSVHAAGVVIGDRPLYEMVPLRIGVDEDSGETVTATQWEKTRAEEFGLVKMDVLGLKTLIIISETLKYIEETTGKKIGIDEIPLDDPKTYKMISKGDNLGVFQLESSLSPLCMKIKPTDVDTVAAINALGRPSCPPEQRKAYIQRRFGIEKIRYTHPTLERALKDTYGISLYEESMMSIARDCAGWDLNEADNLRKLTKLKGKDPELALKTEANFIKGCMEHSKMTYEEAQEVWEHEISSFSGYGFNKSHAISYSIISVQTAWLKCHYPTEFMCATLNLTDPNSDGAQEYLAECKRLGIVITPPDINKGAENYKVIDDKKIATGFAAVKGVGPAAISQLLKAQPFEDFCDFLLKGNSIICKGETEEEEETVTPAMDWVGTGNALPKTCKIESQPFIGKGSIQSLAACGALDVFGRTRKDIYDNFDSYRTKVKNAIKKGKMIKDSDLGRTEEEWERKEFLYNEREVMGRTLSGDTHEIFKGFFKGGSDTFKFKDIKFMKVKSKVKVEGIVKALSKEFKIKNGKNIGRKFGKYLIEDLEGNTIGLTLWTEDYEKYVTTLKDGIPFKAICEIGEYMEEKSLNLVEMLEVFGIKKV